MTPSKPLAGIVAGSLLLSGFSASPALAEIAVRAAQPGRTVAVAPVAPISALPGLGLEASLSLPSAADLSYPAIGVPALEATAALPAVSREPASVAPVAAEAAVLQAAPAPPAASRTSAPPRAVAAAQAKEQGQRGSGAPTLFAALSRPSLMTGPVAAASAESAGGLAERDFLLHAGADPGGSPESSFIEETAASRTGGLSRAAESPERARSEPQAPEAPEVPRYRSALFASVMAAAFSAVFAAVVVLPVAVDRLSAFFFPGADAQAFGAPAAGWAIGPVAAVIGIVAAAFSALAAWDIGLFLTAVGRGNVSEREFWEYARREIPQWNLHPSVTRALLGPKPGTGVLKLYRPAHRIRDFSFGFALGGAIYMRPELIRIPWLFRQVVKHELAHYEDHFERGPPVRSRWMIVRAFQYLRSELRAHFGELRTLRGMRAIRVPVLQRILQEAQLSLKLGSNYDLLLASGGEPAAGSALAAELSDPKAYAVVSGSQARVIRPEGDVGAFLGQAANQRRFRVAVYTSSHAALPDRGTPQGKRLAQALGQLDQIYRLSVRLSGLDTEGLRRSEREVRGLQRLAGDLGVQSRRINTPERIQAAIAEMYRRAARTQFQGLDFVERLQGLFDSVQHRGTLLLPFDAGDPGLDEAERILRYWQAPDGGRFLTERVDLPEGGHILVARKAEARVQLWLRPVRGRSVARSQTNFPAGPEGVEPQRALLRDAGFDEAEIARFERAGMIVRHVFGDDVGEGRVFVSVLRSHAKALKKYAEESRIHLEASRADFTVHLNQAGPIQNIGKAWKLGVEGEGGKIFDIDTGLDTTHPDFADRLLECIDFVGEGPEDWVGHGTHKAGISYSSGRIYRGMAPKALGRMGKVFSRSGFGASDGDIMAAAVEALKWGADVVSLSLGSPGSPDAPLAEFMSKLLAKKNSAGHFPIGTASGGNSGPFNQTMSQPSVGAEMISVAAANKGVEDGREEISFFSSVGPALDGRYTRKRYRFKPEVTAQGGDVTTPPGVKDVYEHGITSTKSKDMPPSPSDADDGRHVRMSGTSMSNPMIAGMAALVKEEALKVAAAGSAAREYFLEHLPFAAKLILMQSARDMGVPVFFQGAGHADAEAAVLLAARTFGGARSWLSRFGAWLARMLTLGFVSPQGPPAAPAQWDWIGRARAVWDLENRVFDESEAAKTETLRAFESARAKAGGSPDAPREDEAEANSRQEAGDRARRALDAKFAALAEEALPQLIAALRDEAWTVRLYAAFALLNIKHSGAAQALAAAATGDADARVRQTAFLALAETPGSFAPEALKKAAADVRDDVSMYAAYALARRGDDSEVGRILARARHEDKAVRFTAAWLLGQLGRKTPPEASDVLAGRVKDEAERPNIRHVSVSSLLELAQARPEAVKDEAVLSLLVTAGPQNFALTRTITKFFKAAAASKPLRTRMRAEPLKSALTEFVDTYKGSVKKPGALGELVQLLADILGLPLDMPTPVPDPSGAGVPGVDPNLGPVHLILEPPEPASGKPRAIQSFADLRGAAPEAAFAAVSGSGLEADLLSRHSVEPQAAMPLSQALWVRVPDPKVLAFQSELEARGWRVRRAKPMYPLINDTGKASGAIEVRERTGLTGKGVLVAYVDEGGDTRHPAIAPERIKYRFNFSDEGGPNDVESESVGHATHGMGIVGAQSVDGSPYVGMAPGVDFAIVKVLGANGGSEAAVMAGLEAVADVVKDPLETPAMANLSLGGPGDADGPLGRLVNKLVLKDISVNAAAGNEGPMPGTVGTPANAALATSVAAVDKKGRLTSYSSRGRPGKGEISWADFGGGVFFDKRNPYEIVSALSTGLAEAARDAATTLLWKGKALYQYMSGTSMAAPHTSGRKAVLIERLRAAGRLPKGYALWLDGLMERTAKRMEGKAENEVGAGLVDEAAALAALDEALKDPAKLSAEANALWEEANRLHGSAKPLAPSTTPGWFHPLAWLGRILGLS